MPISQLSFFRATFLSILIGLAALLVIVGVNLWLVHEAGVYADTVTARRALRSAIVDLRDMLVDAETGQRGYLLTGNAEYLDPYAEVRWKIPDQLALVVKLTANDTAGKDVAAQLAPLVNEKLAELEKTVEDFDTGKREEALATVKSNRGQQLMDETRVILSSMIQRADQGIDTAVREERESIEALNGVTLGSAVVIFIVVGGSAWIIALYTRQLIAAQREVTALNTGLEERVRERTAALGRANEEIQRFAYIVTHDLRAPLVNIVGFTSELEACLASIQDYVRQAPQPQESETAGKAQAAAFEELPEAIGFIRSSTQKMDGLINAILKLSREGRRVLKPERLDLDALLQAATDNVQHQITEAGGSVDIDARVHAIVSDRLALEQVFGNLLDNAIKYRDPTRPPEIRIRVAEAMGQRILVEVQDNGRGIAKQDHERVFDLFRRSGAQDSPGEGIGLAHVRTLVRNLGGDIALLSELGKGTTFKLNLPRDLRSAFSFQTRVG